MRTERGDIAMGISIGGLLIVVGIGAISFAVSGSPWLAGGVSAVAMGVAILFCCWKAWTEPVS